MRHLSLSLVVLCLLCLGSASVTRADLVTSFAVGQVTSNMSQYWSLNPTAPVYHFTVGEPIYITFSYDTEWAYAMPGPNPDRRTYGIPTGGKFELVTGGGYRADNYSPYAGNFVVVADATTDILSFQIGPFESNIRLTLSDPMGAALSGTEIPTLADILSFPSGTVMFNRDRNVGIEGFTASLVPVAALPAAVPEPSSVAMAGLMALAGLGYARRRRKQAEA